MIRSTLRRRLFRSFALIVVVVGALITTVGTYLINRAAVDEAQRHVRLNLQVARSIYRSELRDLTCLATNLSQTPSVAAIASGDDATDARTWIERMCRRVRPDVLTITDASARVVFRSQNPDQVGDVLSEDISVARAASGQVASGTVVWSLERLAREDSSLARRAAVAPLETLQARPLTDPAPTPSLMMVSAVPIVGADSAVVGVVEIGVLLNRRHELVDEIRDIVFQGDYYAGKPLGTVTIFLGDVRVATNVVGEDGRRAVGTRVSNEVYGRVVGRGRPWIRRAFVVDEWYISAYEPIRDIEENVAGILYVGLLERRYRDMRTRTIAYLVAIVSVGLALSVAISWVLARRLARPLHRLAEASLALREGDLAHRVETHAEDDDEAAQLSQAFNHMAGALDARQRELSDSNRALAATNEQLAQLNHDYLDMLGFVSHELKNPLSSCVLNAYSLRDGMLGELTEHQQRAAASMARNLDYLDEMVRKYLDLTRIEQGGMRASLDEIDVVREVLEPALDGMTREIQERGIALERQWPDGPIILLGDPGLLRIVFGNFIGNAIRYGSEAGTLRIRATERGDRWELGVWNSGIGIPADRMGDLFQKFSRIQQPGQPKRKGTGLGLFVTREIVEQHGGEVFAESEPGDWAEFIVRLPKHPA